MFSVLGFSSCLGCTDIDLESLSLIFLRLCFLSTVWKPSVERSGFWLYCPSKSAFVKDGGSSRYDARRSRRWSMLRLSSDHCIASSRREGRS